MKKSLKSAFAISLCLIMLVGTIAIGGNGLSEVMEVFTIKASAEEPYSVGDYIYYGTYPQTDVTNSLGAELNKLPGTWVSYGYYNYKSPSDYMKYKDVIYNGDKYRGVIFSSYRPNQTTYPCSQGYSYQDDNGYYINQTYWFKYEPVKWKVLDPTTGLVMCATIIDSQAYNNGMYSNGDDGRYDFFGDASFANYANDYAASSIRQWLNNDFYDIAFSAQQKSNIKTSTLNNDCVDADYDDFNSVSTNDKVFLLSYNEVLNSEYGFLPSFVMGDDSQLDQARLLRSSDYAKSQGLKVKIASGKTYDGCSGWQLRTPGVWSDSSCFVNYLGYGFNANSTQGTDCGIVPALRLESLKDDSSMELLASSNGNGTHTKYDENGNPVMTEDCVYYSVESHVDCINDGEAVNTCIKCGYSYTSTVEAKGHTEVSANNGIEATCSREGKESDTVCSVCNATVTTGIVIEKLPHTSSVPVKENEIAATNNSDGSYDSVIYCAVCNQEISREKIVVEAISEGYVKSLKVSNNTVTKGDYLTWTIITTDDVTAIKLAGSYEINGAKKTITVLYKSTSTSANIKVTDKDGVRTWEIKQKLTYTGDVDSVTQNYIAYYKTVDDIAYVAYNKDNPVSLTVNESESKTPQENEQYQPYTLVSVTGPASPESGTKNNVTVVTTDDCTKVRIGYMTEAGTMKYTTYQTTTSNASYTDANGLRTWTISYKFTDAKNYSVNARGIAWGAEKTFTV